MSQQPDVDQGSGFYREAGIEIRHSNVAEQYGDWEHSNYYRFRWRVRHGTVSERT